MKNPPFRSILLALACLVALLTSSLRAGDAKPSLPRLVDLGADKCIPCRMMAPILAELAQEYAGQLDVVFIDVWKKREEAPRYGIRLIPTQVFYGADGKELARHEGFSRRRTSSQSGRNWESS